MPSKMNARMVKFTMTGSNEYWDILKDAQDLHVSARDRHEDLLTLCKNKGVAFKDLRNHLLNEAKKVGLYYRNKWEEKSGAMVYPSFEGIKDFSWGHALHTFLKYTKKYVDYQIEAPVKAPRVTLIKRTPQVIEVQEGAATAQVVAADGTTETITERRHTSGLVVPLTEPLSVDKIALLIHANIDTLEDLAEEHGVHDQFLACLKAMGLLDADDAEEEEADLMQMNG